MFGFWRKPHFDADTLSSIWVMACRDDSPVVTAFSIAYRLGGGITPADVMELVKGRRELFRLGLTPAQSRAWKERYRELQPGDGAGAKPGGAAAPKPRSRRPPAPKPDQPQEPDKDQNQEGERKPYALPDWLRVFDDEGPDQDRVREWLGDKKITSSKQALGRFLDDQFVIDENVLRSVFRLEPGFDAPPSDLPTVNWGLEHIDRLRRGRVDTRQSLVALTTGIGGVAIGAFVALTAPMVTTIYQGRPADTNRMTIDHQALVTGYGAMAAATAGARHAAKAGDAKAQGAALTEIDKAAASILPLVPDKNLRDGLRKVREHVADACEPAKPAGADSPPSPDCPAALDDLQRLLDGPLADNVAK